MKNIFFSIGLCAGLLVLAACGSGSTASGGDVTGQVWALTSLNGQPLVAGTGISAQFTPDGNVSGSAGCNQYFGTYSVSGGNITFDLSMGLSMMACPQPVMDQESAYIKALGEAKTFTVKGDELTLTGANNTALATYKAESQDLSGTNWEAFGYNNGKQAVVSILGGTTVTASFDKDGNLTGNAGCNEYNGTYTVNGNKITIGPLASTQKFCNDPEGIMDQETQYLAALETAATYQIEDGVLELRTKDGALAADFNKK